MSEPFRTAAKVEYQWIWGRVNDKERRTDINRLVNDAVDEGWELMDWKPRATENGVYALMRREKR